MKESPLLSPASTPTELPWVSVIPGVPYFQTADGLPWHPIGQNDAVSWRELNPLFRRSDVAAVDAYLAMLVDHGVTCMRLMLEYAQVRHRYFETAAGTWSPNMVQFWDDLFVLCEKRALRILLTPFDTFWMWLHFKHHPYNTKNGGPLHHPSRSLLCRETREAIKARLTFAAERWGGSGALFAWDIWNEIHPAQGEMSAEPFGEFIEDLGTHLRSVEMRKYGRSHPQTVSLFGPELRWRAHMKMEPAIYRHSALDFATIHIYEQGTIDDPKNTVDAALGMSRIVRESLSEIEDTRPFFDTEHGPIHRFKDHHVTLPEAFDDEYFRHMQWAHLASGAAGGGMRWPNRKPHSLTPGMHRAQRAMAKFLPLIRWHSFARADAAHRMVLSSREGHILKQRQVARFGVATHDQALLYLLRRDCLNVAGQLDAQAVPLQLQVQLPMLSSGQYRVTVWDTVVGVPIEETIQSLDGAWHFTLPSLAGEYAIAITDSSDRLKSIESKKLARVGVHSDIPPGIHQGAPHCLL